MVVEIVVPVAVHVLARRVRVLVSIKKASRLRPRINTCRDVAQAPGFASSQASDSPAPRKGAVANATWARVAPRCCAAST